MQITTTRFLLHYNNLRVKYDQLVYDSLFLSRK